MEGPKNQDLETLDVYIRGVENQELKGILLKLKNEILRSNASWEAVRVVLLSLWNKKKETLIEILPFILSTLK
jgi:hypothetical protein